MDKVRLSEIVNACDGSYGYASDGYIDSITTNSKDVRKNSVFIAIKGERFDAHDFVPEAIKNGAECAVTERAVEGAKCIIVDSTRAAYLSIAHYYRKRFDIPLVAITGSVGKTTTKEFIWRALSESFKTLKTEGNRNNDIGLPETLLKLCSDDQAAVIEMGMNHQGEISRLSQCAAPTICVITNIGTSHIENLGSRENILKAKLEILDGADLSAPLVINLDDKYLSGIDARGRRLITYSIKNRSADVFADNIVHTDFGINFSICFDGSKTVDAHIKVPGVHNVKNALAAFCVGRYLGMNAEDIVMGISKFEPDGIRQNIEKIGFATVIKDCYNASYDSMQSGLDILSSLNISGRRIAVLGDMKELGSMSKELHKKVGELVYKSKVDMLLCFGKDAEFIIRGAVKAGFDENNAKHFKSKEELAEHIKNIRRDGDAFLFKASRSVKLEEVIEKIK